eukprot:3844141-Pleurochrysis_carterae.AAC.5
MPNATESMRPKSEKAFARWLGSVMSRSAARVTALLPLRAPARQRAASAAPNELERPRQAVAVISVSWPVISTRFRPK